MTVFYEGASRLKAKIHMAWAYKIVKVEGGYMGFEFEQDYRTWRNQK